MAEIKLSSGEAATVDEEDVAWLRQYRWYLSTDGYAFAAHPTRYMHRMIMQTPKGQECDHRHHNKLDNRKSELRNGLKSLNMRNKHAKGTKPTEFKGVTFYKSRNKWLAQIRVTLPVGRKTLFLGRFETDTEAAKAYNVAALKHFGGEALLNPV